MTNNLRLYPWYQACRSLLFWSPVFFLYFAAALPLDQVLLLEAVYYLGVVVLEVPSGYFSDRIGRRPTLLIAMTLWAASGFVFAATSGFVPFAVAQILLAAGMAFNSGTDTSLLYDSLAAEGRESEIGAHEAKAQSWWLGAMAFSALVGGFVGGLDLRIPYLLSGVSGCAALAVALRFREPPRSGRAAPPFRQLLAVGERLRDPVLAWIFVFAVGMTVLTHVPYEMYQPYLGFVFGAEEGVAYARTPAIAGALACCAMLVAAFAAGRAMAIRARLGVVGSLLATMVLQLLVILSMAFWIEPWMVLVICFRSVPASVLRPITLASIHPRLETGQRATYLSVQSLVGRLAFSASLALAGLVVGADAVLEPEIMRGLLHAFVIAGALLLAVLSATAVSVSRNAD